LTVRRGSAGLVREWWFWRDAGGWVKVGLSSGIGWFGLGAGRRLRGRTVWRGGGFVADIELPGEAAGRAAGIADHDPRGLRPGAQGHAGVNRPLARERLSICAPASAPLTLSEADSRSAPRPTSTADRATGAPAGTWPLALGAMVRTMGGAATTDGDANGGEASGDGLEATPGDGGEAACVRAASASLAASVGGTPAGVGASLPGTAPALAARWPARTRSSPASAAASSLANSLAQPIHRWQSRARPGGTGRRCRVAWRNQATRKAKRQTIRTTSILVAGWTWLAGGS